MDMISIEQTIKNQYAKFFAQDDWQAFKTIADYYFKTSAYLMKRDIKADEVFKLLIRNIQKRLFIGIGTELLLKAFYLKNGYGINKPKNGKYKLYKINKVDTVDYDECDTYTMNYLIQEMEQGRISEFAADQMIIKGLKIAKVFRNKEGHIASDRHQFDPQNYSDVEQAIASLYNSYFNQKLTFHISMQPYEKGIFEIESIP